MRKTVYFYKELTPAEVGKTGTHEIYIRLPNNFDHEAFFGKRAVENGSVLEINFSAIDTTNSANDLINLRFAYFINSNQEKRIPSLGELFKRHNVQEGDIVCIESLEDNSQTAFYIHFYRNREITITPSSIFFMRIGEDMVAEPEESHISLPLQQIFYGAPGTGKSHEVKKNTDAAEKDGHVFRTTFHPDSDYSTFVGCYKPTTQGASQQTILDYDSLVDRFKKYISDFGNITHASAAIGYNYHDSIVRMQESGVHTIADLLADAHKSGTTYDTTIRSGMLLYEEQVQTGKTGDKITYAFVPQAFTNAYVKAWNTKDPVFLIIEEINRGNCAQIFGDLFQLLDRKDGVSEYPVDADSDLANYIGNELAGSTRDDFPDKVKEGKKLVLPSNLYIWATMNTSDQSLFPIDSAFKRRWEWKYIPIKEHPDKKFLIEIGEKTYDWWGFLERINKVIGDTTSSEDKKLGYFFVKTETSKVSDEQFVGKVLFYLWNDVFKNYGFDHTIFSKGDKDKFVFSDFFNADGTPNKDNVQQFLKRLEETIKIDRPLDVTPKEEPTTISEEATESEA